MIRSLLAVMLAAGALWLSHPAQAAEATLPPALQAAILSGNSAAVQRAITTLSGGNPVNAANLAAQTIAAAEQLLAANPAAAVEVASVAVETMSNAVTQQAAPQQLEQVLTTAARIFASPAAQQIVPTATAELAGAALQAAATSGNATLVGQVASSAITLAENLLTKDATAALTLAGQAVDVVTDGAIGEGDLRSVMTTAARIVVSPEAAGVPAAIVNSVTQALQSSGFSPTTTNITGDGNRDTNPQEETTFRSGSAT